MSRVARYHADRTNQKLYFARLACQQAEQTDNIQQAQAHREAAVFHLHGAILAFLQELVRYYRLNDCLLYTSPSPRDRTRSRMPSSA